MCMFAKENLLIGDKDIILAGINPGRDKHKFQVYGAEPSSSRNIYYEYDKNLISSSQFVSKPSVKLIYFKNSTQGVVIGNDVEDVIQLNKAVTPVNNDSFWEFYPEQFLADLVDYIGDNKKVLVVGDIPESCKNEKESFLREKLEGRQKYKITNLNNMNERMIDINIRIIKIVDSGLPTIIDSAIKDLPTDNAEIIKYEDVKPYNKEIFQVLVRAEIIGFFSTEVTQTYKGSGSRPHSVPYGIIESVNKIKAVGKKKYGLNNLEDEDINQMFIEDDKYKYGKVNLKEDIREILKRDFKYMIEDIKKFYSKDRPEITIVSGGIMNNKLAISIIKELITEETKIIIPEQPQYSEARGNLKLLCRLIAQGKIKL